MTTQTPTLRASTRPMSTEGSLTDWVSAENPLTIQRLGNGVVGLGQALVLRFRGPHRFADAASAWRAICDAASVDNPLEEPGTGLVCFGTFAFSDESSMESVLIVPRVVIGRSGGQSWRTEITVEGESPEASPPHRSTPGSFEPLDWQPGLMSEVDYQAQVSRIISSAQDGAVDKVVLARDLVARAPGIKDWRLALTRLAESYPDCYTFAIDGLVGSSPETLAVVRDRRLGIRVLAGSIGRGASPAVDRAAAQSLITSSKDQDEHRYAVTSVMESLAGVTPHVVADDQPFTVKLANVWHLATDIEATLPEGVTALDVVAAVHPSAAVAGSPRDAALEFIEASEPFDRGRYAGPVGWMDQAGNGEWAIALRCAQWTPEGTITAYAGAGVVADSDPAAELLETRLKFKPVIMAFGGDQDAPLAR